MIFVSVIINTKNAGQTLENCLKSVKEQTYKNFEVIIVDNNSTDNTKQISQKYTDKVLNFGPERSYQKNLGAKKAVGVYLLFIDVDMELNKNVIKECVKKVKEDQNLGAIIIPEESFGEGFWAAVRSLEKKCYLEDPYIEAARFFLREMFLKTGGYDENLIAGEDWDLTNRLKGKIKIGRINSFLRHNEGKLSLLGAVRKKFYYSKHIKKFIDKNKNFSQLTPFRIAFLRNWRLLLANPILSLGLVILKTCEFGAGLVGLLISPYKKGQF